MQQKFSGLNSAQLQKLQEDEVHINYQKTKTFTGCSCWLAGFDSVTVKGKSLMERIKNVHCIVISLGQHHFQIDTTSYKGLEGNIPKITLRSETIFGDHTN